jgi:hypothetical protein
MRAAARVVTVHPAWKNPTCLLMLSGLDGMLQVAVKSLPTTYPARLGQCGTTAKKHAMIPLGLQTIVLRFGRAVWEDTPENPYR